MSNKKGYKKGGGAFLSPQASGLMFSSVRDSNVGNGFKPFPTGVRRKSLLALDMGKNEEWRRDE